MPSIEESNYVSVTFTAYKLNSLREGPRVFQTALCSNFLNNWQVVRGIVVGGGCRLHPSPGSWFGFSLYGNQSIHPQGSVSWYQTSL